MDPVGVEAAGYRLVADGGGGDRSAALFIHPPAHDPQGLADVGGNLRLALGGGVIAPDAEHGADDQRFVLVKRGAHKRIIAEAVRTAAGFVAVKFVALAQHIVVVAVGVDNGVALLHNGRRGGHGISVPPGGPVADLDVLVKGHGGIIIIVDAVIEGPGGQVQALEDAGQGINIVCKVAVPPGADQMAKAMPPEE